MSKEHILSISSQNWQHSRTTRSLLLEIYIFLLLKECKTYVGWQWRLQSHKFSHVIIIIYLCNNNNIFIWYSATSIIVRGASQHITI